MIKIHTAGWKRAVTIVTRRGRLHPIQNIELKNILLANILFCGEFRASMIFRVRQVFLSTPSAGLLRFNRIGVFVGHRCLNSVGLPSTG